MANDHNRTETLSIEYYKIPSEDIEIVFVDSVSTYERLLDCLFNINAEEELFVGFDCMLYS